MKGRRRLRLVTAGAQVAPALPRVGPIDARGVCVAIAEVGEAGLGIAFASQLAAAFLARGVPASVALCDFERVPPLASDQAARFQSLCRVLCVRCTSSAAELAALVADSGSGPRIFVGEPAVLDLRGALAVVFERQADAAGFTPRAGRLRSAAHLLLSSPRAGVASALAAAWPWSAQAH